MKDPSLAVVFVSNGPGELSTWVRPVAEKLHKKLSMRPKKQDASISLRLVLVPCPNATGVEKDAAQQWGQFDEISPAKHFWKLLLNPKKYSDWPSKGLVVFLGGDQFWSVLLSAKLGYRHITYAEWIARWPQWNDRIAAMSQSVKDQLPKRHKKKCTVVGDLMADINIIAKEKDPLPKGKWVALLPGSKSAKLSIGVPFLIEVADHLANLLPESKFLLPIAPTTNINALQKFNSYENPIALRYSSRINTIELPNKEEKWKKIITSTGTKIYLHEKFPAHNALSQCELALTTVGANTAELGALGIPMIVIVPTQHLTVMQAWDGFLGLIGRLPVLKKCLGLLITIWRLKNRGFLAWPNITAGRMVVPERVGKITPNEIAIEAAKWLLSPKRLKGQKEDLQSLRGKTGASEAMTEEIINLLENY